MSESAIIKVENLSKSYLIRHQRERHAIHGVARRHRRKIQVASSPARQRPKTGKAAQAIRRGVLGAQGRLVRGRQRRSRSASSAATARARAPCSKSCPASPSRPTGRVHMRGRVASLLEVGTGFHPELTGRENIFLNGAILGMSRAEINTEVRRDRRVRRGGEVPRHAGQTLLQRHVRAAGLRRRGAPGAGDPDRGRGAGGRRRAVPEEVPGQDG